MGCIPWADRYMIRGLTPRTRNDAPCPCDVASQERRRVGDALTTSYTTHHPEGKLGVRRRIPASVASATRGGVACNDAAARQEGPILGWVRGCSRPLANEQRQEAVMADSEQFYDLVGMAWVLLANVSEGDWTKQTQEWQDAVVVWRDNYHAHIAEFAANSLEVISEGIQ